MTQMKVIAAKHKAWNICLSADSWRNHAPWKLLSVLQTRLHHMANIGKPMIVMEGHKNKKSAPSFSSQLAGHQQEKHGEQRKDSIPVLSSRGQSHSGPQLLGGRIYCRENPIRPRSPGMIWIMLSHYVRMIYAEFTE